MSLEKLETALTAIEQQFDAVSIAIVKGEPTELESLAADLKELVGNLLMLIQGHDALPLTTPGLRMRILALKDGLSSQRTNLFRRTVQVEGALNALVPSTRSSVYGAQSTGRYGANVRQTGAFKVLAA